MGLFLGPLVHSIGLYVFVLMFSVPRWFCDYSSIVYFEVWSCDTSSNAPFVQDCFDYSGSLGAFL